jgi:16S rRNA (guanine966-N2)-methyltransferase
MDVRIISGVLGGRRLRITSANAGFRPTSERVRKAVADSIRNRVPGAVVADICAGSGAFGFEMLSRGAGHADFVETSVPCLHALREHAVLFGVERQCRIIGADALGFSGEIPETPYNIVFYDPPYDSDTLAQNIPAIAGLCGGDGVCIVEHRRNRDIQAMMTGAHGFRVDTRLYGDTAVSYITRG